MDTWEFVKLGLTFALGALTAVFAEPIRRLLFRARLKLEFIPTIGLGTGNVAITPTTTTGVNACYVRVLVKTCNRFIRAVAPSCQPFLARIEKEVTQDDFQLVYHDPLPLPWSSLGIGPRDIPPGIDFYFDVLAVDSQSNVLIPQTGQQATVWFCTLAQPGVYRFTVAISGENVRMTPLTIRLDWRGQWNSFAVGANGRKAEITPDVATSVLSGPRYFRIGGESECGADDCGPSGV